MTIESKPSKRPYLIRAMHEWITDIGQTPHVVVDASCDQVVVPEQHVSNGKIILNLSLSATQNLELGNHRIEFSARFSGADFTVYLPVDSILGIYARESGQGMVFTQGTDPEPDEGSHERAEDQRGSEPPHLKVVK